MIAKLTMTRSIKIKMMTTAIMINIIMTKNNGYNNSVKW